MRNLIAALALGLTMPSGLALADNAAAQTAEDPNVAVVREMIDAWNTMDWDRVVGLFAEDGSLHSMMVDPVVGRDALAVRIGHLGEGLEEITLNVRNLGSVGDVVFLERVDQFVFNGHSGSVPVVGVIEVNEDGLIQEWREYYDRDELLEAMGVVTDFDSEAR